jgi:hypothetical protein
MTAPVNSATFASPQHLQKNRAANAQRQRHTQRTSTPHEHEHQDE